MEKAACSNGKPKKKILKYLPRAASAVSFQNPPFSPARTAKGFSGPIVSIIPEEALRKSGSGFDAQEPTSPKVSCMGKIKIHRASRQGSIAPAPVWSPRAVKKRAEAIRKIFRGAKTGSVKSSPEPISNYDNDKNKKQSVVAESAPSLGQMRRFASGRHELGNFDWTAQMSPREEVEVVIPYSAPMAVGGEQPRKEVNLWKRRTMTPPKQLQLHKIVTPDS